MEKSQQKKQKYKPLDFNIIREKSNQDNSIIAPCVTSASTIRVRCSTEHKYDHDPNEAVCPCEEECDSHWGTNQVSLWTSLKYKTIDGIGFLPIVWKFLKATIKRKLVLQKKESRYEEEFKIIRDTLKQKVCKGVKLIKHTKETAEKLSGESPSYKLDDTFPHCYEFTPSKFYDESENMTEQEKRKEKRNYVTCFYFHGGGFMYHSPQYEFNKYLSRMAKILNIRIFAPNYRKTPNFSYPTPINDCYDWTTHFLKNSEIYNLDPKNFCMMGDSAGGTCVMSLLVRLFRTDQQWKPFYICGISPVVCGAFYDLPSFQDPWCINAFSVDNYIMYALSFSVGKEYYDCQQYILHPDLKKKEKLSDDEFLAKRKYASIRNSWTKQSHCLVDLNIDSECFNIEKYLPIPALSCLKDLQQDFNNTSHTTNSGCLANIMNHDKREDNLLHFEKLYGKEDLQKLLKESQAITNPEIAFFCMSTKELKDFTKFFHGTKFHFNVAEFDSTRDEILMVANRMIEAKARVTWSISRDMPHDFPFMSTTLGGFKPSANKDTLEMLNDMKEFIDGFRPGGKKYGY